MNLSANEKTTLFLPAGQVLSVVAASGASGSAIRMAKLPGGGDAQSITAIAGANLTFGPYAATERFEIICTAGTLTITTAVHDPSLYATDEELADATTDISPAILQLPEKTPVNAVAATKVLTFAGQPNNGETVTIGGQVYTFKTALTTNPAPVPNEVLIGADAEASRNNLVAAINKGAGEGTTYGTGTVANAYVTATATSTDKVTATAKTAGAAGNDIAVDTDVTGASWADGVSGVNSTTGKDREMCADANYYYISFGESTVSTQNWRKFAKGDVYY